MASLFDTTYGDTQRGIGWYPRREPQRATPSLWDYIEAAAMTPVPGVADVASGALAARDFGAGRWGQGLLNAAGTLPVVPALGQIFIGAKGANKAQKQALVTAQRMAKEGADRDEIWNATMWYRGKDGKWRTEIDDSVAQWKTNFPEYKQDELQNIISHDAAYQAYPWLKDVDTVVQRGPVSGSWDDRIQRITAEAPDRMRAKSVVLHEMSHPIQQREGMARGGSPEAMAEMGTLEPNPYLPKLEEALNKARNAKGSEQIAAMDEYNALNVAAAQWDAKWNNLRPEEAYRRLLGEVDARNTQKRMDMTLDQRRQFAPWSTWDVPEADQIVRMEGGPAMLRGLLGR